MKQASQPPSVTRTGRSRALRLLVAFLAIIGVLLATGCGVAPTAETRSATAVHTFYAAMTDGSVHSYRLNAVTGELQETGSGSAGRRAALKLKPQPNGNSLFAAVFAANGSADVVRFPLTSEGAIAGNAETVARGASDVAVSPDGKMLFAAYSFEAVSRSTGEAESRTLVKSYRIRDTAGGFAAELLSERRFDLCADGSCHEGLVLADAYDESGRTLLWIKDTDNSRGGERNTRWFALAVDPASGVLRTTGKVVGGRPQSASALSAKVLVSVAAGDVEDPEARFLETWPLGSSKRSPAQTCGGPASPAAAYVDFCEEPFALAISPDSSRLFIASRNSALWSAGFDPKKGLTGRASLLPTPFPYTAMSVSTDGRLLLVRNDPGSGLIGYRVSREGALTLIPGSPWPMGDVASFALSAR